MCVLAAVYRCTTERIVGVVLVEPIVFVKHRYTGRFDRGNVTERIPHYLEMIIHFTTATHIETLCNILASVTASARKLQFLKKVDMLALHLSVSYKIEGCRKSGKSSANDIS